ncbi:AAA family ATPase, partial [Patescibacteria group bacterium]|nr:AAA family ATPase [Patescibacteria group bacterium]
MEINPNNLSFEPGLNLLRVSQRKIKKILAWLVFLCLIFLGLYGIFVFIFYPWQEYRTLVYFSLLIDMFLFYLWRQKKNYRKIRLPKEGETLEILVFLDGKSEKLLEDAYLFARRRGYHFLRPIHFFAVCLKEKKFRKIIKRLNCSIEQISAKTESILAKSLAESGAGDLDPKQSSDFKKVFSDAYVFCLRKGYDQITPIDILWSMSRQKNLVGMIFDEFGIASEEIERVIEWSRLEEEIKKSSKSFFWRRRFKPRSKLNRALTAVLTPTLDKVSQDLTLLAKRGDFELVIGREKEIGDIFNFFSAAKTGVVLVGEDEVGKKSIIKKLAQLMIEENVPNFLKDKRLIELNLGALVGLSDSQKVEERLKQIIAEVNRAGNIILVIENIDNLVGLKSQAGGLDLSEILVSPLEDKEFFLLGTSLSVNHAAKIEGKILGQVLEKIEVAAPSRDFLWKILITKIYLIEKKLKVFFSADSLDQAIDLAERYIYGKSLPAKVIDLLTEAGYLVSGRRGSDSLVKGEDIVNLVSKKTKIPMEETEEPEKHKLLNLEKLIHQRLINQEEAVKAVSAAMRRSRLETKKRNKPIASFLFVGPTGVGKTELAKTLAQVYFGDEKKMIRLDMSEYQEKRAIRRLIGLQTDAGVEKGYLTEMVKRQPYS